MTLSGATLSALPTGGWRMIFKGAALFSDRSGWHKVITFYLWSPSVEEAEKVAWERFPNAKRVILRVRGG